MVNKESGSKGRAWKTKIADVGEKGQVEIAVNAFNNEDDDGDISAPGSFTKTINENFLRAKWFLNHDKKILLGVPQKAEEADEYLKIGAQLNMEKQISRDTYFDYKLYAENGRTLEHSIGVDAIKRDKADPRKVTEWKLWEFSTLTSWGANERTPLLSLKNMGGMSTDQMAEQLEFITKAIKEPYSDERLASIEKSINMLTKIIKKDITDGALMVCCPYCGEVFDYNQLNEHTFEQQVLEAASNYARWMVDGIVSDEIRKLKPEFQMEVQAIINAQKSLENGMQTKAMQTKGLENFTNYVRCEKCWTRVYKCNVIEPGDSTQETDDSTQEPEIVKAGSPTLTFKTLGGLIVK